MSSILIISKSKELREAIRSDLRKTGYSCTAVEEAIDGLNELRWHRPEVIIWEIQPRLLREIKSLSFLRARHGRIPLILIVDDPTTADMVRDLGETILLKATAEKRLLAEVKQHAPLSGTQNKKKKSRSIFLDDNDASVDARESYDIHEADF